MSCERYLDLISARMDGELTLLEESKLSAHLRECSCCRAIAEDLKGIRSALSQAETAPVPDALARQVMDQIQEETKLRRAADRQRRRTIRQLSALAACLVLCVGIVRLTPLGKTEPGAGTAKNPASAGSSAALGENDSPVAVTETNDQTAGVYVAGNPAGEPSHYLFCNDQYIRVSVASTLETPSAHILGSVQSLKNFVSLFPENDLSAATKQYGEEYFKTGRLLAVVLEEPSGSNRHRLAPQGLLSNSVTVIRQVPEVGTCDMATWLILAEVDTMFHDGQQLRVDLTTGK